MWEHRGSSVTKARVPASLTPVGSVKRDVKTSQIFGHVEMGHHIRLRVSRPHLVVIHLGSVSAERWTYHLSLLPIAAVMILKHRGLVHEVF